MSATAVPALPTIPVVSVPARKGAPTISRARHAGNLLRSEWTKFHTVRSTFWTLLACVVLTIGLGAIICAVFAAQFSGLSAQDKLAFDAASTSLAGGVLAQLAIGVLGVLVITGEYANGMIRTTFAAVPQRTSVLAAKATVFAAIVLPVTLATCFAAFFVGQAILSTKDVGVSLGTGTALRLVVGSALYLTVLGLIALGLGTLIRKTAGAITAIVGLIFVVPGIAALLPSSMDVVQKFLPTNAGQALLSPPATDRTAGIPSLSPWMGFLVFAAYAAAILIAAAYSLRKRDA
jgi:ABC-type transport system involved in multi-copper enzyme maturation permease subunit